MGQKAPNNSVCLALPTSFGRRGSQVQILPLRPILIRILVCFRDRYRDRNVIHVVAGRRALACSRAEAPMVFDLFDQSGQIGRAHV